MSIRALTILPSHGITPPSIPNNILWLDPTDNSTITLSSGKVSQWSDKSGVGNNVVQTTSTYQWTPTAAAINGLQAMLTPNINTYAHGSGMTCTLIGGALPAFTIGMLVQTSINRIDNGLVTSQTATGDLALEIADSNNTALDIWVDNVGSSGTTPSGGVVVGTNYWVVLTYDGTTGKIYMNNVLKLNSTTHLASRQLAALIGVGGDAGAGGYHEWFGYIGDVAIWSRALTATEVSNTYTQFAKSRWGLP
jgi:hypothetical protein